MTKMTRLSHLAAHFRSRYRLSKALSTNSLIGSRSFQRHFSQRNGSSGGGDEENRLESLFSGSETALVSPWEVASNSYWQSKPMDFARPLDFSTRYLMELLQELNDFGFARHHDVVTLERCRATLRALVQHQKLACANRAYAILEHMEALIQQTTQEDRPLSGNNAVHMIHPHSGKVAEWPAPDREVYRLVLQSFAALQACPDPSAPRMAQSIVHRMEQRSNSNNATATMKPDASDWNAVLRCWRGCQDWQRSVLAATETFSPMLEAANGSGNNRNNNDNHIDPDAWVHMMLICTPFGIVDDQEGTRSRAAATGAEVAARLWHTHIRKPQHMDDTNPATTTFDPTNPLDQGLELHEQQQQQRQRLQLLHHLPSHFYAAFLQSVRHFPTTTSLTNRVRMFDECFELASLQGKVNREIMNEFLAHVPSKMVKEKHLGPYLPAVDGFTTKNAAACLVELVPPEWTARADLERK